MELRDSQKETDRAVKEASQAVKELAEENRKTELIVKKLSKNIGGVNKSFGRLMEEM
jgi:hypothetical protein